MVELYCIRHAQSKANSKHILASQRSYSLTALGHTDAELAAVDLREKILGGSSFDVIISSPLIRAVETADHIAKEFSLSLKRDSRLSEQHLGRFSGMSYREAEADPGYEQQRDKRWNWVPDGGGESYAMICDRVSSFLADLSRRYRDEIADDECVYRILLVTHAVTMRLIHAVLTRTIPEYPDWIANNGEVWRVNFTGIGATYEIERLFPGESRKRVHRA